MRANLPFPAEKQPTFLKGEQTMLLKHYLRVATHLFKNNVSIILEHSEQNLVVNGVITRNGKLFSCKKFKISSDVVN